MADEKNTDDITIFMNSEIKKIKYKLDKATSNDIKNLNLSLFESVAKTNCSYEFLIEKFNHSVNLENPFWVIKIKACVSYKSQIPQAQTNTKPKPSEYSQEVFYIKINKDDDGNEEGNEELTKCAKWNISGILPNMFANYDKISKLIEFEFKRYVKKIENNAKTKQAQLERVEKRKMIRDKINKNSEYGKSNKSNKSGLYFIDEIDIHSLVKNLKITLMTN